MVKKASKKDEKVEKLEKLEGGFNLYVNGAHRANEKYTPRHTTVKSTENRKNFNFKPNISSNERSKKFSNLFFDQNDRSKSAPSVVTRKKWSTSSFTIKTTDGYEIKINAPNAMKPQISKSDITANNRLKMSNDNEFNYSEDFESDSENESEENLNSNNKNKANEKQEESLIESVKFSDISDIEDNSSDESIKQKTSCNNKKFVLDLSPNDIKVIFKGY